LRWKAAGKLISQTTVLRKLYSHILLVDEDFIGAARALIRIPMEGGSRYVLLLGSMAMGDLRLSQKTRFRRGQA
jgi:hypothetical protein